MVGAVITTPSGLIAGEGWHRCWGEAHAEVNAVAAARARGTDLSECTIYVTLEPCAHYGKTPPCARLLAECGFRRAVIGTTDPFPKVAGRGLQILREAGIELTVGVLERECRALNRRFFFAHTHRRPWVMLKWAQSADGYMAAPGGERTHLSTPVSEVWMHRERAGVDAIMVGTGTLLADNPRLSLRLWPGRQLRPVVLMSPRLHDDITLTHNPLSILIEEPAPLPDMLHTLYADYGVTSLMVEGGSALLRSFIDAGLWQEMRIEVATKALGHGLKAPGVPLAGLTPKPCGGNLIYTLTAPAESSGESVNVS